MKEMKDAPAAMNDATENPSLQDQDDLGALDDRPPAVPLPQCFDFYEDEIRVNDNGRKRFGDRFRRAGFDIEKIRTHDQLKAAMEGSWHIVMSDHEREFEKIWGGNNSLFARGMRALFRRDYDRAEYLLDMHVRMHQLGLKVISGEKKAP